ncbi:MAG: hypothetical protein V4580_01900 [Bacteroidota bacterium]
MTGKESRSNYLSQNHVTSWGDSMLLPVAERSRSTSKSIEELVMEETN